MRIVLYILLPHEEMSICCNTDNRLYGTLLSECPLAALIDRRNREQWYCGHLQSLLEIGLFVLPGFFTPSCHVSDTTNRSLPDFWLL